MWIAIYANCIDMIADLQLRVDFTICPFESCIDWNTADKRIYRRYWHCTTWILTEEWKEQIKDDSLVFSKHIH